MAKIRTIHGAWKELKIIDPECCVSEGKIRQLVKAGMLPHSSSGKRIYINLDTLLDWLEHPERYESQAYTQFSNRNPVNVDDVAAVQGLCLCDTDIPTGRMAGIPAAPAYGVHPVRA